MRVLATGIGYPTGRLLYPARTEQEFAELIADGLEYRAEVVATDSSRTRVARTVRGERKPATTIDPRNARAAGWTYLVNGADPHLGEIKKAIRPLAVRRGMTDIDRPLTYADGEDFAAWIETTFTQLLPSERPSYVLIVGGPAAIPFGLQSFLDVAASVGRLAFDHVDQLAAYVEKLLRLEKARRPVARNRAVVFAPDAGIQSDGLMDATHFSRLYMAEPLRDLARTQDRYIVEDVLGARATKSGLVEATRGRSTALLYTASHGALAEDSSIETHRKIDGAIVCQSAGGADMDGDLFSAADVPSANEPFVEGGIVIQFACFGYGTPAESDFNHWLGVDQRPEVQVSEDLVSALPKALLAHPRGPIAYVGHLDTAFLHGFHDPADPFVSDRWHPRLAPFRAMVKSVLDLDPIGLAMTDMNLRYDLMNSKLATVFDLMRRGRWSLSPETWPALSTDFIVRGDARNFMVFGDPAARLRIDAD